ncbi:MAG: ester cyclase, partial [Desulfosarcinaceae bacterium]
VIPIMTAGPAAAGRVRRNFQAFHERGHFMTADCKTLVHKIFEQAYSEAELDILDGIIAGDYVRHQPPMREIKGLAAYKKFIQDVRGAYSGFNIRVEEVIVEGPTSVARIVLSGRHTGQAPTIQAAPTHKQVEMAGCVVSHWTGDKISEEWVYNDYLGLVQQFGVVPPPGLY